MQIKIHKVKINRIVPPSQNQRLDSKGPCLSRTTPKASANKFLTIDMMPACARVQTSAAEEGGTSASEEGGTSAAEEEPEKSNRLQSTCPRHWETP